MGRIFSFFIVSIILFFPSLAQAQTGELREQVVIKESGRIFVNGKPSGKPKLDLLENKYVFRYKVVDEQDAAYSSVIVDVQLPEKVQASAVRPEIIAVHGVGFSEYTRLNRATIQFTATDISPGSTFTIVIDLPRDAFHLTWWSTVLSTIQTIPPAGLIAVGTVGPLLSLLYTLWILISRSRDVFLRPTSPALMAAPTTLPPAMVGTLLHGYASMREIAATYIDLARRGYIDIINRGGTEFAFSRKRDWEHDKALFPFERYFLSQIFSEHFLSESEDIDKKLDGSVWSEQITHGIEGLYKQMVELGYFKEDPRQSHMKIRFIGMLLFFVSVTGLLFTLYFFEHRPIIALPWLISMISTPLLLHVALLAPHRTDAGRDQAARWLSFKQFMGSGQALSTVSSTDAIQEFERYLAYSMVLSVEAAWTQRYAQLPCQVPSWFYSQRTMVDSYASLATALFAIIGFVGAKFSSSRNPTAL
jgi:hypothetical protein